MFLTNLPISWCPLGCNPVLYGLHPPASYASTRYGPWEPQRYASSLGFITIHCHWEVNWPSGMIHQILYILTYESKNLFDMINHIFNYSNDWFQESIHSSSLRSSSHLNHRDPFESRNWVDCLNQHPFKPFARFESAILGQYHTSQRGNGMDNSQSIFSLKPPLSLGIFVPCSMTQLRVTFHDLHLKYPNPEDPYVCH